MRQMFRERSERVRHYREGAAGSLQAARTPRLACTIAWSYCRTSCAGQLNPYTNSDRNPAFISSSPCVRKMPSLSLSLATLHEHKSTFTTHMSSIPISSRSCERFLPFVIAYVIKIIPCTIRPDYYKANSLHRVSKSRLTVARISCSPPALFTGGNFSFFMRFEVPGRTVRCLFVSSIPPLFVIRSFEADGKE